MLGKTKLIKEQIEKLTVKIKNRAETKTGSLAQIISNENLARLPASELTLAISS